MPVQSKYLAASRVHVLLMGAQAFKSFFDNLESELHATQKTLAEYRKVWEGWQAQADAKGVVSIPKEELGMELIRILTGTCCGNAESVAEDIADDETGLMLGGRLFVHPRAGQPILPPGKMWYVFHFTPAVKGHAAKPAVYSPMRQVVSEKLSLPEKLWEELNWQDRLVPHGEWALVIEGTTIAPEGEKLVKKEDNTLHKLAELRGLGTGFLVTTMRTEHEKTKKRSQWIKVGMFLPLSQAALAHVLQLAADLRDLLPWLHLDKAINVSVRVGDTKGLLTKNHTGGYEAVRKIAPAMAQKFWADGKGVAWKIQCKDLPTPSPEMEFERVVAAYNKPKPTAEPKARRVLSSEDIRVLMGGNWADDTDDEELEPFQPPSVAEAEPPVAEDEPPVAEAEPPVAEAPSVAEPVAKTKSKTRRGGAAARKRRQRAQTQE